MKNAVQSRLVGELFEKADSLGLTQKELSERLGISDEHMSRWRRGLREAPDPRWVENRDFYVKAARFLDKDVAFVLGDVLFLDQRESQILEKSVHEAMEVSATLSKDLQLSREAQQQMRILYMNALGRESFVPALVEVFRSYVETVLCEKWFTDPVLAVRAQKDE